MSQVILCILDWFVYKVKSGSSMYDLMFYKATIFDSFCCDKENFPQKLFMNNADKICYSTSVFN